MPCRKKIDKVSQTTLCLRRTAPTALSIRSSGSSAIANSSRQAFLIRTGWYWKCSIEGAPSGSLKSKKVVIKDNVCVASVPMVNGPNVPRRLRAGIGRDNRDADPGPRAAKSSASRSVNSFAPPEAARLPIPGPSSMHTTRRAWRVARDARRW